MSTRPHMRPYAARRPPIFRVKTGCFTCRGRKKKCDEVKPLCSGCKRNKLSCRWPTSAQMTRRTRLPKKPTVDHEDIANSDAPCPDTIVCLGSPQAVTPGSATGDEATGLMTERIVIDNENCLETPSDSVSHFSPSPSLDEFHATPFRAILPNTLPRDCNEDDDDAEISIDPHMFEEADDSLVPVRSSSSTSQNGWESVPSTISPFPCQDGPSFELLSHYLSRTALSMGNGSTLVNPFVSQLVPLSFANRLILDLVLCQSAAHRAMEDSTQLNIAHGYYNKSPRLFRKSIQDYVDGKEANSLWIAVGALIMCFTETAKGDSQGIIFDHIKGAGPLLTSLLSSSNTIPRDLKDFVIEYYVYTASISMISIDPTSSSTPFLSLELERQGERLVETGYVGQLCGGWLELLLLLPQVFRFGQRLRDPDTDPALPTSDDFLIFSALQMKILSFQPSSLLGSDVVLCSNIFKQAIHLYLLTSLTGDQEVGRPFHATVANAIDQAFEYLRQLPSTSRINTSLCWALGVIGSCVTDEDRRNELRARLDIMFLMIGLGNIRVTSALLEHIWALPRVQQSPWAIWQVMRDNQVWISFA
ncbi:hypothetical protein AK830_g8532 [Neonectria ditissima]|uniref:Zn(2)-C6 fungal-type domain-containing protein n=1 Tax=Neonectria ditissima TaxID=78410 RepID=A0A0P7AU46_9HYPO|nr:hypothetical protein AK830_g8532 [Neonectria ditissima]